MKIKKLNDNIIKQVLLLIIIFALAFIILYYLKYFIPGFLGAITMYILFRKTYIKLTEKKGWKRSWTSILLMLISLIAIAIPIWLIVEVMIPQISGLLENQQMIVEKFNAVKAFMKSKPVLKNINLSEKALMGYLQKAAGYLPILLNSIAAIFVNTFTAFFILYFMQVNWKLMEKKISLYIPFREENKDELWAETNMMVRSNALGIPILAVCQGIVAMIGYLIFGVKNPVLWGLMTGAASIVPAVGTMLIWVPICIVQFATGDIGSAVGLTLFCLIGVGGVDNILRFTILKKLGDVHPLITVFGVLLGLNIFGVMGLIFGPLLISYFLLLSKIYRKEFGKKRELELEIEAKNEEILQKEKILGHTPSVIKKNIKETEE